VVSNVIATIFLVFFGRTPIVNFIGKRGIDVVANAASILGAVSVVVGVGGEDLSPKANASAAVIFASSAVADVVGTDVMLAGRREKVVLIFAAFVDGVFFLYEPTPRLASISLDWLLLRTHSSDEFAPKYSVSGGDVPVARSKLPSSAAVAKYRMAITSNA